jgi:hypothetical protein
VNNIIKIGLGLALAIVYPFMIGLGIEGFYASPKQAHEVCRELDPNIITTQEEDGRQLVVKDPQTDPTYKQCFDKAQAQVDIYNRNLFLIATAFGFAAIATGTLMFSEKIGPIGPALIFGGLFTIAYGQARSFASLDKRWLFAELVVVFIGIILITYRFLQTTKKK